MVPPIWILLTTYKRTEIALRTIQSIKQNLQYSNIGWVVVDDGTGGDHLKQLTDEIGWSYQIHTYDGQRKGVGHNMNVGLKKIDELGGELILVEEEDWLLNAPFDPTPHVNLLMNNEDIGMVRMGYLSAGLSGEIVALENKLWLKFYKTQYVYTYAGHANLRHKRFHERIGMYSEGLPPGANELDFCAKYNSTDNPPAIVWDLDYNHIGPFHHIGGISLADTPVGA